MKNYFFGALLCLCFTMHAQDFIKTNPKYPSLFKSIPTVKSSDPLWVKQLYSSSPNVNIIESNYKSFYKKNTFVKTIHTQNYKHFMGAVYLNNYLTENGNVIIKDKVESKVRKTASLQSDNSSTSNIWNFIGPFDTYKEDGSVKRSSQANVYTFDQSISNPNILISGTETGAVFISTDKGENWTVTADELALYNRGIGSVKIDPSNENTMYIGASYSLYQSTDKGANWSEIHNVTNLGIKDISINPNNANEIVTTGNLGTYRSIDKGVTWTLISSNVGWDIERKVDDPKVVFVAATNPATNVVEIYKTTDITAAIPVFTSKTTGYFTPTNTTADSAIGARIGVTNANPDILYVLLLGNDVSYANDIGFLGVYKSDDAGETWTLPYDGDNDGSPDNDPGGPYSPTDWCLSCFGRGTSLIGEGTYSQGFFNASIAVSDTDPNTFLVGMLTLFKSTDGAKTFKTWGGYACDNCGDDLQHPDIQEIEINGNDIWVASDGGIDFYSHTDFKRQATKNKGMNASEYWGLGQGWQEDVLVGGRYHNGNSAYRPSYANGNSKYIGGGEAPTGYVNLANSDFASFSDLTDRIISKNLLGSTNYSPTNAVLYPNQEIYNIKNRSEVVGDPRWGSVHYIGKDNKLWKTVNNGVSYDLVYEFIEGASTVLVTDIEIPRSNPNYIFTTINISNSGTLASSKIYRSTDGGITWTELSLPSAYHEMELQVATDNENEIYISFSNDWSAPNKVFKSIDGGVTWINLTTPTLDRGVRHLIIQDGTDGGVYAVTYKSIYYRNSLMTDWVEYESGLPTVKRFNKLLPFYRDGKLRVATYNRGMTEAPLFEVSKPIAHPIVMNRNIDCSRNTIQFEDYSVLNYAGASWEWTFPGASSVSSTTVRNPIVTYSGPGNYDVTLKVTDVNGNTDTKTVSNMISFTADLCKEIKFQPEKALSVTKGNSNYLYKENLGINNIKNLTVSGWFKPEGEQVHLSGVFSFLDEDSSSIALNINSEKELRIHWKGGQWGKSTGLYINQDEWNYFAFVTTENGVTLYLNDEKASINFTLDAANLATFFLGGQSGLYYRNFNGKIDEVKFWTKSLTEDEIRMERHVIETDVSDSDLLSYWQCNSITNNQFIYDLKSENDLTIYNTATLKSSTAPIGGGCVEKLNITAPGMASFVNSGVDLVFANGTLPNGDIYVSKINNAPDAIPNTSPIKDNYFIINNYGDNKAISALSSITFKNLGDLSSLNLTGDIQLFKRKSNDDSASTWPSLPITSIPAFSVSSNVLTFISPGITSFSQFYFGNNMALNNNYPFVKDNIIRVFPNPVSSDSQLNFTGIKGDFTFTLYDLSGKMIDRVYGSEKQYEISNLPTGMYLYSIETSNKIRTSKLIVK